MCKECYKCNEIIGVSYDRGIELCGRCRQVKKFDLVKRVLEMDQVYLDESNINKNGRPRVVKDDYTEYKIRLMYEEGKSYREIGAQFGVSKSTISKVIKWEY